jgi:aminopeptidase N
MMALGMEYPGIVAVTRQVYSLDDEVRGVSAPIMMEGTVGHEVAHQWFYNLVGNDQIDEPWLDEALAQYLTGLYYLDRYGERGYEGWRGSWLDRWERVDRAAIPIGLPVAEYETGAYGAVVYGRGPLFIEALAKEMEPETFEAFLRDYVETHAWDIGTGEAFKGLAEKHCQCDLTPLFREWVYPE